MRALPSWVKGFVYSCLCIFTLGQTGFGQGPAAASAYGKLPLSFEPNQGQTAGEVQFLSRGRGYTLFLTPGDSVLALHRGHRGTSAERMGAGPSANASAALRMHLVGANRSAPGVAEDVLPGKSNYLIGNDRTKWRTDVPNYGRVRYRGVYPGIDLVYYGNQRLLEHDFVVAPGADPRRIRLAFDGIQRATVGKSGDLVLQLADGEVRLQKPVIYQNTQEGRREVAGGFVLGKNQVTIQVGSYDRRRALVIDPVLGYSTYLGGNGEDVATSLAVDGIGNAYLAGYTASTTFPTTAGVLSRTCQNCGGGTDDVFVAKINPTGTALVYSTYISGTNDDEAYAIAIDGTGNAYVTGFTNSSNFPVTVGAYQPALKSFLGNSFVSVLNSTGTSLLYSTFLGGTARDFGNPIALDGGGNIYVGGISYSTDFPTIGTPVSTPPPTFYASSNGGTLFSAPSSDIKSLQLTDVVVDKFTAGTLYVGSIGGGVYKSTNSGVAWVQMPTPFNAALNPAQIKGDDVLALVMDPTSTFTGSTARLYAGSEFFGISRTLDGGASWTQINNGSVGSVLSLALNPLNTATLYVGTNGQGVWVSNNANSPSPTFSQMSQTGLNTVVNALAVDPVNGTVYAGTPGGVFKFSAGTNSWVALTTGITANASVNALAVDPSGNLYAATSFSGGIFKFNPSTQTWTAINGSGGTAMTALAVFGITVDPSVPATLYAGTQLGIFKTTDGGTNWTLLTNGLVTRYASRITVDPNNSLNLYVGSFNPMSFVAKFPAGGGSPLLLTQFGGVNGQTFITSIAADSLGNSYVGGTINANLPPPLVGPQTSIAGLPSFDAFISKITPGQTVAYSRYLGGSGSDQVVGLAVDSSFNAYASGITNSFDFPVTPATAFQPSHNAAPGNDAFVVELDPTGATALYSSYFGGSGSDFGLNLALLSPGIVAIVGQASSTDLPTVNAIQPFNAGSYDTFFAKFDLTKSGAASLLYSTYLGGSSFDAPAGVGFDSTGNAYVNGYSYSSNFPTTAGVIQGASSGPAAAPDAVVFKLQSTGNSSDVGVTISSPVGTTPAEGTTYAYTLHASDSGPNPAGAPSVVVSGTMPTNLTVNSVIAGQGTCSGLQTFTCSLGTVAFPAAGVDVTVNVTANTLTAPPVGPTLTATVRVATADDDPVPVNNVTSTTVTVQRRADLTITGISSPASVTNGAAFNYSVTAANNGPSTATGIIVSYSLPASVTFNQGASSAGCALSTGTVTCPVVNLTPFSSTVIVINVTPHLAGSLSATFTVSSSQVVDDGPGGAPGTNNTPPPFTVNVKTNIDLSITTPPSLSVPVGGSAAFNITVTNNGTDTATGVSLTGTSPAGLLYVGFSSSSAGVSCSAAGAVTCTLPDIPSHGTVSFTIFASSVLQGTYLATASLSFSGTDANPADNTASTTVTVIGALGSNLTTLLTDYESSTIHGYSGYPTPAPVCCGLPTTVGASPANVVIAPNGRLAFTGNVNGSYISVVDLTIQAEIARIRDVRAFSLDITSDGQKLVSVGQFSDELDVVDIATLAVTRISLDGKVGDAAGVNDIGPFSLALIGYKAYIANTFGPVIVVNFATPGSPVITTVTGTAALFALHAGHQVAATPDGSTVAVFDRLATGGAALIYLINTSSNTSQTVTTTFGGARTIAIARNSNPASGVVAFLGFLNGAIRVLDLRIGSPTYGQLLAGSVSLGSSVTDMALTPDGNTLQAVNGVTQAVSGPHSTLYTLNAQLLVTSPSSALVSSVTIPNAISVRGLAIGYVQTVPSSSAPQIFDVVPSEITNEAPKTITIFGDNFAPGVMVRIGNLDPLPSTFVTRQQITVSVPAAAAVQLGTIVVTLPNSAAGPLAANVSGSSNQNGRTLRISPPPTFAPSHPVAVSSFSTPKLSLLFRDSTLLPGEVFSPSVNISSDGLYAYSGEFEIGTTNLDTAQSSAPIVGPGTAFFDCGNSSFDGYAIAPDPTTGKKVLHFVGCDAATESSDTLYFVDVDPTSTTTRNTLLARTIQVPNTDFGGGQALAATPDGRFVYSADRNATTGGTRLVIFDVLNSTSTIIPDITTLGADPSQQHILVTPDGHSLLLSGTGGTTIRVYDIQGANALAPALVTTITGSGAPTTNPPLLYWFQVVGTRLFTYASDQRYVQVFNFDRVAPNFAVLGSYTIPSPAGRFSGAAMAVSPEGTLIYAVLENEDAVAVLDANLVATSSPSSLITKMRTAINPANVAFSPRGNGSADLLAAIETASAGAAGTAAAPVNQPFDIFIDVQNHGPSSASGVTMTLSIPAGVQVNSATILDAIFAGPQPCTVSSTQVVCPVSTLESNPTEGEFVIVNATIASPGSYVFTNTVLGNESDPNPGNNTATLTVNAGGGADVSVFVSASANPAPVGSPVTLSGVVTNNGPNVATAVSAFLSFSFSTLPTFSTTQGTCTTAGICSLGDIGPGASVTISATTTLSLNSASQSGIVAVTGSAFSSTTPDPNVVNNSFSYNLQLTNPASSLQRWMVADRATGQIYMFDPATNSPIGRNTDVGVGPDGIAISPNGHTAFVANLNATYISVVDLSIQREIYRIRFGGANVRNVAFTTDGSRVVAMLNAPTVLIIDAVTFQVLQTVNLSTQFSDSPSCVPAGPAVVGHQAYVGCVGSARIAVVDANSFAVSTVSGVVGSQTTVGNSVMAATPDGQYVLALRSTPSIQIISTASNSVVQTVSNAAITASAHIAIGTRTSAPLGTYGYFGTNTLNVLDLTPSSPTFGGVLAGKTVTAGINVTDLAVSADGTRLYAISSANTGNNVAVVDTGALLSGTSSIVFQGRFGGPCINFNICPGTLRALAAGRVDTLPIVGAPIIFGVTPNFFFNDTATTVTISGFGFAPDARVRVGKIDGLAVTFVSSNALRVTIPVGAPANGSDIIVTNPNASAGLSGQLLSAFLKHGTDNDGLEISVPITFQPKFQAAVSDSGAGIIDFLQQAAGGNGGNQITVGTDPMGIAFSPDGSQFYVESLSTASVIAGSPGCCQSGQPLQQTQISLSGSPGQSAGIAVAPDPGTGKPVALVASQRPGSGSVPGDVQLNVIDVNPYSPAVNSVLYTIPAQMGSPQTPGGLAVTANGRYVYQNVASNATNPLVIFDTLARSATLIPNTSLGIATFQPAVHITPDNRSLLLGDNSGNVKVFDISANPLSPTLVTTIAPTMPPGMSGVLLDVFRVVGNHLYTYDVEQRVVEVFNFNRTSANFSFINYFKVPGSVPSPVGFAAEIAVTPDESLVYVPVREDDAVFVLDAAKLISGAPGDPTALVTSIATAQGPGNIALSPKRLDTALEDVGIAINHSPDSVLLGGNVTFNVTLTNYGPFTGSGTQDSGNGGFLINFDPSLVPVPGLSTLASSPFVSCGLNGTQLLCGFTDNGPDLGPPPQSISGTIVFQTTAVRLAGVTGYIAAGNGSYDPNPANNTATDAVAVVTGIADVAVTMTASASPVAVLDSVTYQITLTNNGPSLATGVVLTDTLPAGALFASIDDLTHCAVSNGVLTCNFASLAAGSGAIVNLILVPLVPSGEGTFANTAAVTANEPDPDLSNNSATQNVQVTGANLSGGGAVRNLPGFSNTITPPNDDDSFGPVPLGFNVNFFGVQASSLFVNNNGNVTFGSPLSTFTPFPLPTTNVQIIAPYFSDVETFEPGSGLMTYGADTVNGRPAFGVNWPNVKYCCGEGTETLVDLFQLVLVDRSDVNPGDFDIELNYDKIQWETGDASSGLNGLGGDSARVGYSNGTGTTGSYFEFPGSGVPGSFLDGNVASGLIYNTLNSAQPGRYVFQVRNGLVQSSADLAITATGPQFGAPGSTITYALTAVNHGPNTATGVTVIDTLPVGLTFVSTTQGAMCPTPPTPAPGQPVVVTCDVGSIANGSTVDISIQATIAPGVSGLLTDTAVVSAPNNQDLNLGDNTATVVTNTNVADLAVSMTPSATQVAPGSNLTYTITVTNNGPSASTGYTLTDTLPSNATFVSATAGCVLSTALTCTGSGLASGQSANYVVVVTPTAQGTVSNTASVSGTEPDLVPANNSATVAVTAIAVDLAVSMTAAPPIVAPGSNLTYTITVTNNGPSASTGHTLTDTLPSNATFVSATSGCVLSTVLTCSGPSLGVGLTSTYVVVVSPTTQATLTNTASVTGNEPDPVPGNNSVTLQDLSATADLAVSAAGAPSPVGGFPAYAATVTNNGPSDATNVVLTDLLDNFGFVSASSTQGSCTFSAPTVTCSLGTLPNGASAAITVVEIAPDAGWAANLFAAKGAQPDPNPINNSFRLGPSLDSFNTPVGNNVGVNTSDPADNLAASLTFSNVTRAGSTTMASMSATSLPSGFRSGRQPAFFDISTNAELAGSIAVKIQFVPANFRHPALVRLFHFEGGTWVDRTMGLNVASGTIVAKVMSLSPFALLEPVNAIPMANPGADHSVPGAMAAGARVMLDGSASVDADADPLTYRWSGPFPEGGGTVTGVNPTVTLPLGASKVSLVVNDGEADSSAVALNLTVADFQVNAPVGSVALTRGQSASFTITMTPQYGAFGAPINLSCAPGASEVTCSFSSASVTPGATASTATLTVTAAATVARVPGRSMPAYLALWLGALPVFGGVFLAAGRRKKWQMAVLLLLVLVLVASHIGCGGGGMTQTHSSASSSSPSSRAVTITVTGTSGTLQHSSAVTVTLPQ